MFLITEILITILKTFTFWFSFRLQSQADGRPTFSVNLIIIT